MAFKKGTSGNPEGRPKGSGNKPTFRDYFDEKERLLLVATLKKQMVQDANLLKFVAEQIFGKAAQSMDITSLGESLNSSVAELPNEKLEEISAG